MNVIYSKYELERKNAILVLWELSSNWEYYQYSINDYFLDKALRQIQGFPEKQVGKPPYEWLK